MSPFGVFDAARTAVRMIGRAAKVQAYEVALMASVAAMAPLHLVGGGLDPSCGPRSPVQAHTAPTTRPVLLVHGFGGTKSSWSLLAQALSARGLTVEAVTYTPIGTSVEQLADRLVVEVDRMLSRTGSDKVHLVGHSLGGVVIAQAIAGGRLNGLVDTVVTLGHPSEVRRGQTCCRSGRLSERCGKVRHYCADSPARRYRTGCGGWHSRPRST